MPWWSWILLRVVLILLAGLFLYRIGRSLWRRSKLLFTELGEAGDRLSEVQAGLQTIQANLAEQQAARESGPAVFADPSRMRQERFLAGRSRPTKQRVR